MSKNHRYLAYILILILALVMTACQAEEPFAEICPIDETAGEFDEECAPVVTEADPAGEAYPVEETLFEFGEQSAYPITEADLSMLLGTWRLAAYFENGVEIDTPDKTLTFTADGSYTRTTADDVKTGAWTTVLRAMDSTLMLDPDSDQVQQYEMIDLSEMELKLYTWRDNIGIEERYLPVD